VSTSRTDDKLFVDGTGTDPRSMQQPAADDIDSVFTLENGEPLCCARSGAQASYSAV
jgi:hypothetical protein